MLFFELFPAVFAIIALITGVVLFAVNRRALNDPQDIESTRTPSRPSVSPDAADESSAGARRPSMRA